MNLESQKCFDNFSHFSTLQIPAGLVICSCRNKSLQQLIFLTNLEVARLVSQCSADGAKNCSAAAVCFQLFMIFGQVTFNFKLKNLFNSVLEGRFVFVRFPAKGAGLQDVVGRCQDHEGLICSF